MTIRDIRARLGHIIYELTCVQGPEETPEVKVTRVTHRLKALYMQLEHEAEGEDADRALIPYYLDLEARVAELESRGGILSGRSQGAK